MFWVLPSPTRQTGFAVLGSAGAKCPLLQFVKLNPLTAPAVSTQRLTCVSTYLESLRSISSAGVIEPETDCHC